MSTLPRISLVTGTYNQGRFIAETIESVLAQNYPNLEHIVVDGMSTDETPQVLARYPHLRILREPDQGLGDALNKGFRMATGDIFGFLNSDDTLLPGALDCVARQIDPARARHIVMGRCRFIDEEGRYFGIEHPSRFESFRRVLEVWKGHLLPQPAVFWTPEVWRTCGPAALGLSHIDYDLFCRFARRYRFHQVDQVLATYRLHPESHTVAWSEAERLEDAIRISRHYWGPPWRPLYWRLALSLAWFRWDRAGRARRHYHRAEEHRRRRQWPAMLAHQLATGMLAPDVAFHAGIYPHARQVLGGALHSLLERLAAQRALSPRTAVYLDRTELWADGWAGPRLVVERECAGGERTLLIRGTAHTRYMRGPLELAVAVDGVPLGRVSVPDEGDFRRALALPAPAAPGRHTIAIHAGAWVVYHRFLRNGDHRPLSWLPDGPDAIMFT